MRLLINSLQLHFYTLLDRRDPSWIIECVRENLAKERLKANMLKDKSEEEEITEVVQKFFEVGDKSTHGMSIGPDEAKAFGKKINMGSSGV